MQGVYYQKNKHTPWICVWSRLDEIDPSAGFDVMKYESNHRKTGRITFIQTSGNMPNDCWDLRNLPHKTISGAKPCKFWRDGWEVEKRSGRRNWIPVNPRQMNLGETK